MNKRTYRVERLMAEVDVALERRGPWTPVLFLTPFDLDHPFESWADPAACLVEDHEDLGRGCSLPEKLVILLRMVIRKLVKPYFRFSLAQINRFHARTYQTLQHLYVRQDRLEAELFAYIRQLEEGLPPDGTIERFGTRAARASTADRDHEDQKPGGSLPG